MEDTVKDFWATRPRRPRRGRKVAGVAAGIGNRYGIDPIVVRVAFVVATFFGGAGVPLYLLGWLLLPEQDDEGAPLESMVHRRRSSMSSAFAVLLCLALFPALYFMFENQAFGGVFGFVVLLGALYLLHRTRGHLGRPPATGAPAPETIATPASYPTTPYTPVTAEPAAEEPRTSPPKWDPLGAAPFAWDLPEPSQPAPEPPPPARKSKAGMLTLGAVLVTGGILAMVGPYGGGWLTAPHIIGIVLGVLGLGMVGGSFVRGGRGLIGLAVPLSVVGIGLTVISPEGWHGVGEITARPLAVSDVQPEYRRSAGRIDLDLTGLPSSGSVETTVKVDTGQVVVTVPENADVELRCKANVGDLNCLGRSESGSDVEFTSFDTGADGAGGLRIELNALAGAGQVEVRRG